MVFLHKSKSASTDTVAILSESSQPAQPSVKPPDPFGGNDEQGMI